MTNARAIEVLKLLRVHNGQGYTAIDRDDAYSMAIAALAPNADRWWDTYHAALIGLCGVRGLLSEERHSLAIAQANLAHGALVQP